MFQLCAAFVGFEAAVAFNDFVQNYERVVSVEDIIVEGKVELTEDFGVNEHSALVEKFEAEGTFTEALDDDKIANVAKYFITLPSEVAMKLWTVIGQANQDNAIALHGAEVDGERVSGILVEMLTGKKIGE
jgi:hypothetical protein